MEPQKKTFTGKIKGWAKSLKTDLKALHIALSENLVPWYVKISIGLILGYALSPIDLIPDFIPVIGLLDDLLLLPFFIYLTIKMIPEETMKYCREEAEIREFSLRKNWIAGTIIILIWFAVIGWIIYYFWK